MSTVPSGESVLPESSGGGPASWLTLGKLSTCAWTCIKTEVQRLLGRDDVVPGTCLSADR